MATNTTVDHDLGEGGLSGAPLLYLAVISKAEQLVPGRGKEAYRMNVERCNFFYLLRVA